MFDWKDYFELSKELMASTSSEAKLRSAISRFYYACYCECRNRLRDTPDEIFDTSSDAHREVKNIYENNSDTTKQFIGTNLEQLRKYRNKADYWENAFPTLLNLNSKVNLSYSWAEEIFNYFYPPPPTPPTTPTDSISLPE